MIHDDFRYFYEPKADIFETERFSLKIAFGRLMAKCRGSGDRIERELRCHLLISACMNL